MWILLNDSFFSIVKKHCSADQLLVRARRPGDIERAFGRRVQVMRSTDSDYLFRAVLPRQDVERAIAAELRRIDYGNFKDSVHEPDLHDAYMAVWSALARAQNPPPYSEGHYLPPASPGKKRSKRNGRK
jgi:hypothetical protein